MTANLLEYFFGGFLVSQAAGLATTLYLHRSSTHRSIIFHPIVEFVFQMILWLTTGLVAEARRFWVGVHLWHHAYTDIESDPHSPVIEGFWKVQFGGLFLFLKAKKDPRALWYGRNVKLTPFEKLLGRTKYLVPLGPAFGISLACIVLGLIPGLMISGVHAVLYLFVLNNLVNGWCHVRGYKNYKLVAAFNNRFIALITMGEGLHNNHHHRPGNPKLSDRKDEIDPGGIVASFLVFCRLAEFTRPSLTAD